MKMISGEFNPFIGPIKDKNGNVVLAQGQTWTPEEFTAGFNWTLEGVEGLK